MVRRIALVAAMVVAGTTSVKAQDFLPDPVVSVYRLSYPVANREGDIMNYVCIATDGKRTYWNNVPRGLELSPGFVNPPRGTFSRSRTVVQNGWKHSVDVWTGTVAGSVPTSQTVMTAKPPLPQTGPAPIPEDQQPLK